MLEEDQAGFRIPMSLGEPHAELDASQCPRGTQEASSLGPFFPRIQDPGPKIPLPPFPLEIWPPFPRRPPNLLGFQCLLHGVVLSSFCPPGQAGTSPCPTPQ